MDTYVCMPREFFLSMGRFVRGTETMEPAPRPLQPWGLSVWTTVPLYVGTRFNAQQGSVVVAPRASSVGNRQYPQVWRNFGCYEEIRHDGTKPYERHCNWVCFLQSTIHRRQANILVYKIKGKAVFEVTQFIPAFTELVSFFQVSDHSIRSILNQNTNWYDAALIPPILQRDKEKRWSSMGSNSARMPLMGDSKVPGRLAGLGYLQTGTPMGDGSKAPGGLTGLGYLQAGTTMGDSKSPGGLTGFDYLQAGTTMGTPLMKETPLWVSPRKGKERTSLPCQVCGKAFDRPSLLRRHMRTHTGEKPHGCTVCGKAFSTSSSLNTHCRIHSGEKPHVCGICGKRFTASSNLYYHRMTHSKDKPHKCTMCCKSFPTPGDLRSHMFVHNGSWPFKCHLCNRGFSKHTNLKNHIMLHTGEKPHVCLQCGKRFALVCNLKSHSKTHQVRQDTIPCRSKVHPTKE